MNEVNKLRKKYEPGNTKNLMKQCSHKDREWNLTINSD